MIDPRALIKLFGYNGEIIDKQMAGMAHADSLIHPPFGGNCLNWVLGHIISSRTHALLYVSETPVWGDAERAVYRFGSSNPGEERPGVMRLEKLLADFDISQARLTNGLERLTYEAMCAPSGYQDNTLGDSLAYFHFHEALHIGQILMLAKLAGKDEVWLE